MGWLSSIVTRFCAHFRKGRLDTDLDDELRFHLEMEEQENVRNGMNTEEARRQARLRLGGMEQVKEAYRDRRGIPFLESLRQDLRFAFRSFRRDHGFTATVLVTLTLGIGVGTAIFSIVDAVLLKPPPYRDPERVVMLWSYSDYSGRSLELARNQARSMSSAEFLDRQRDSRSFEDMAAVGVNELFLDTDAGAERMNGLWVSEGFFDVLGVEPILGRRFLPEEYHSDWNRVAIILQYDVWRTRFGSDPEIIGKRLPFVYGGGMVVGVMPPGFAFLRRNVEYLRPLELEHFLNRPREFGFLGRRGTAG